ncbi:MAG: PD-(D/E)XK nuclease family protein [Holosporaceae bacterium]|jgi:ATP-dependent helicase/nuclease subunit B|nr:PD-(D/E)XK nuclease family protein [Holosporaceae bacterium]
MYKIPITKRFLPEVADFFLKKKLGPVKIFLPNRRSCQTLKQLLLEKNIGSMMLPIMSTLSDELQWDDNKITALIMRCVIQNLKNENISANVMFELSKSICTLLNDLVLADIDPEQLQHTVPEHLQGYWNPTLELLLECAHSPEIHNIMRLTKIKFAAFLASISHQQVASVGIENTDCSAQLFLRQVFASENSIIFMPEQEQPLSFYPEASVALAEFSAPAEEALGVAIAVRKAIHEQKNVLLVINDPKLLEKIKMELRHWNIVPASGEPFSKTHSGMLVSLVMDMIEKEFNLQNVLDVLKFTGQYTDFLLPFEWFCRTKSHLPTNFFDVMEIYNQCEFDIVGKLKNLISHKNQRSFGDWFDYGNLFLKLLDPETSQKLETMAKPFRRYTDFFGDMNVAEFVIFLKNQLLTMETPPSLNPTDNVVMVNINEAQLLDADLVVIAGANDGNLKVSEKNDFWMSKSMFNALGIQTATEKNAFTQRIFERLAHKSNVLISRSRIVDGVQQQRYVYLDKITDTLQSEKYLENFVATLLYSQKKKSIRFQAPIPDLENRPRSFSVSDLALLRNNAYAFYAKKILLLKELNYINNPRNLKGNYVHNVLEEIIKTAKINFPEATEIAKKVLQHMHLDESDLGMWFFRLKNILTYVCENIDPHDVLIAEIPGYCTVDVSPDYSFEMHCRADRIDVHSDQSISIIDYKTSSTLPTKNEIEYGYKPQLSLEAIIAQKNGFSLEKTQINTMYFLCIDGSGKTGEKRFLGDSPEAIEKLIKNTRTGFTELIRQYNVLGIPYDVNVNDEYSTAYIHLARVKEWNDDEIANI